MEVTVKDGNSAVLVPPGGIDITNSSTIKEYLGKLIDEGCLYVDVDFSNVDFIDSAALGRLLLCHKKLKDLGGYLRIINVSSEYVEKIFDTIQLSKVMDYERK